MTEMIYRPQTNERHCNKKPIIKTQFKSVPMDALVIEPEEVPEYVSEGWFDNPNQMFEAKEEIPGGEGSEKKEPKDSKSKGSK